MDNSSMVPEDYNEEDEQAEEYENLGAKYNKNSVDESDLSSLSDQEQEQEGEQDIEPEVSDIEGLNTSNIEDELEDEEDEEPESEDEEDNYKLEDPDEIDEDLELKDELEEPPKESQPKSLKVTISKPKPEIRQAPARETRKRQLPMYEEDELDDFYEEDEPAKPKKKKIPKAVVQPTDLDADLILTDEETEYNPHANPDLSKMTERQRARYLEEEEEPEDEEEEKKKKFIELDDSLNNYKKAKPKKKETEEEAALRKAENARKRLDYKNKMLEEEKRDTLNKLLKRRAAKTREVNPKDSSHEHDSSTKIAEKPRRPTTDHPAMSRWINNTSSLNGHSVLGLAGTASPTTIVEEHV
ncbi:hypothetical protein HYPBUDRAFT_158147 [Hyphopichia burtonii NRRL Y-1933]|uniref:INO80 complex subunit B-like conserved region domain-containing protein n=1 Tax=Hyphopichia burtonii NRRL Y-1933 TaxID=984485 RepID=A0A1E4RFU9_9ASCO|nr:hypothetical protein HYPBUDRAFT_158147 [Hyphopichia burtonii NRRL Y-1933]ODV66128.1 hypothetical protein HYPBUDRAFT_158147 [Hyphopichia burtonii NRRL Y-1933]